MNLYKQEQTASSSFPRGRKDNPKKKKKIKQEGLSAIKKPPVTKTHLEKTTRSTMGEVMKIFPGGRNLTEGLGSGVAAFLILIKFESVGIAVPGRLGRLNIR